MFQIRFSFDYTTYIAELGEKMLTRPPEGGGSYIVKWQGCSSYLLGFGIPIFGISYRLSFLLKFETYGSVF